MFLLKLLFSVLVGLQFSPAERAYLVESVAQQNRIKSILTSFEGKFGKKVSRSQVYKIYAKFKTEYTCHNLNSGRSGKKKNGRSPENIENQNRNKNISGTIYRSDLCLYSKRSGGHHLTAHMKQRPVALTMMEI